MMKILLEAFYGMIDENVDYVLKSAKVLKHKKLEKAFIDSVIDKLIKQVSENE